MNTIIINWHIIKKCNYSCIYFMFAIGVDSLSEKNNG